MTNDIDVLKMAVKEYDKAIKIKRINEQLFEQLIGSIYYILKYSETNNIPLPKRELIYQLLERCPLQYNKYFEMVSPTENQQRNKTPDDETEPIFSIQIKYKIQGNKYFLIFFHLLLIEFY